MGGCCLLFCCFGTGEGAFCEAKSAQLPLPPPSPDPATAAAAAEEEDDDGGATPVLLNAWPHASFDVNASFDDLDTTGFDTVVAVTGGRCTRSAALESPLPLPPTPPPATTIITAALEATSAAVILRFGSTTSISAINAVTASGRPAGTAYFPFKI